MCAAGIQLLLAVEARTLLLLHVDATPLSIGCTCQDICCSGWFGPVEANDARRLTEVVGDRCTTA